MQRINATTIAILLLASQFVRVARAQEAPVNVLYAGALITVMEKLIGPAFHAASGYGFQGEGNGSLAAAKLIRAGLRSPDVFISADAAVNESELLGAKNRNLAEYYVTFAAGALVIGYNGRSRFAGDFERARAGRIPWYEVLAEPALKFGRTDPNFDPKGYRTLFMFGLAENYYKKPGLSRLLGDPRNPQQIFPETELMVRLEAGQLDAGVFYRNEAIAHKLPYLELPDAINQSNVRLAQRYRARSFTTDSGLRVFGSPIVFTVAPLSRAKNPRGARAFIDFILSPKGQALLKQAGLSPAPELVGGDAARMPPELRSKIRGAYVP